MTTADSSGRIWRFIRFEILLENSPVPGPHFGNQAVDDPGSRWHGAIPVAAMLGKPPVPAKANVLGGLRIPLQSLRINRDSASVEFPSLPQRRKSIRSRLSQQQSR
jgi:hypothetical protein